MLISSLMTGCQSFKPKYSHDRPVTDSQTDRLWKSGYGFNNPNPERIRNGLEPVSFSGQVKEPRQSFGDRLASDVVTYTIFEGIPAAWRGLTSRWRERGDDLN